MDRKVTGERGFILISAMILVAVVAIAGSIIYGSLQNERNRSVVTEASVTIGRLSQSSIAIYQSLFQLQPSGLPFLYPKPYLSGAAAQTVVFTTPSGSLWTPSALDAGGAVLNFMLPVSPTATQAIQVHTTQLPANYLLSVATKPYLITNVNAKTTAVETFKMNQATTGGSTVTRNYRIPVAPPTPPGCQLQYLSGAGMITATTGQTQYPPSVPFGSTQTVTLSVSGIVVKAEYIITNSGVSSAPVTVGAVPNGGEIDSFGMRALGPIVQNVGWNGDFEITAKIYGPNEYTNTGADDPTAPPSFCRIVFNSTKFQNPQIPHQPICSTHIVGTTTPPALNVVSPPVSTISPGSPQTSATIVDGMAVTIEVQQTGGFPAKTYEVSSISANGPWAGSSPSPPGGYTYDYTFRANSLPPGPFTAQTYTIHGAATDGAGGVGGDAGGEITSCGTVTVTVEPAISCTVNIGATGAYPNNYYSYVPPPIYVVASLAQPQVIGTLTLNSGIVASDQMSWAGGSTSKSYSPPYQPPDPNLSYAFSGAEPGFGAPGVKIVNGAAQGPYQSNIACTPNQITIEPAPPICAVEPPVAGPLDVTNAGSRTTETIVVTNATASVPSSYVLATPSGSVSTPSTTISGPQLFSFGDAWMESASVTGASGKPSACAPAKIETLPACHMTISGGPSIVVGDPNECVQVGVVNDHGTPIAVNDAGSSVPPASPWAQFCGNQYGSTGAISAPGTETNLYGSKSCGSTSFNVIPNPCRFANPRYVEIDSRYVCRVGPPETCGWETLPVSTGFNSTDVGPWGLPTHLFTTYQIGADPGLGYCAATDQCYEITDYSGPPPDWHDPSYFYVQNFWSASCSAQVDSRINIGCFDPDTPIRLADGGAKPAKAVRRGDWLWNPVRHMPVVVTKVTAGPEKVPMVEIFDGHSALRVTTKHPVYTATGVVQAKDLHVGDLIMHEDGEWRPIVRVASIPVSSPPPEVWNFVVAGGGADTEDHLIEANGFVSGDLFLQERLQKATPRDPAADDK